MRRFIQTFQVGEVGVEGTRRVLEGGRFAIGGSRGAKHMTERWWYQDPLLIPYVGQIVYFADNDDLRGRISVHEVTFKVGKPGTRGAGRNRSVTGDFICYAYREENAK
jgi:hypothetical protein